MTNAATTRNRHRFDVRVWFHDGSRITVCNIVDDRSHWNGQNAKTEAEQRAGARRYADRGGIRAVAIARSFETPDPRA